MENSKKGHNTIENFIKFQNYMRASQSERPNDKCKDCSALFIFKNKTRCYAYEQQRWKDKEEFNPRRDFNCNLFDENGVFCNIAEAYRKALIKGNDPDVDSEYQKALKEENDFYDEERDIMNNELQRNGKIKTVFDFVNAFQEDPQCRDCKYCRPNYAPLAPTSHICENDEVENDFIFGEDEPCDKWEYRQGKSAPSSEDVFYSSNPEYRNLFEDDEWDDNDEEDDND